MKCKNKNNNELAKDIDLFKDRQPSPDLLHEKYHICYTAPKKENKNMNIVVMMSILFMLAESSVQTSEKFCTIEKNNQLQDSAHIFDDITNCTIETDKIKAKEYVGCIRNFRIIKNLLITSEKEAGQTEVIVEKTQNMLLHHPDSILTCFYKEILQKNGATKKKCIIRANHTPQEGKSILISMITLKNKKIHDRRIEKARKLKKNSNELADIQESMKVLDDVLHITAFQLYKDMMKELSSKRSSRSSFFQSNPRALSFQQFLSKCLYPNAMCRNDAVFYTLCYQINNLCKRRYKRGQDIDLEITSLAEVNRVLKKEILDISKEDLPKTISNLEEEFMQKEEIIKQIEEIEKDCVNCDENTKDECSKKQRSLLEKAKKQIRTCINIVSNSEKIKGYANHSISRKDQIKGEMQNSACSREMKSLLLDILNQYECFAGSMQEAIEMIRKGNEKILSRASEEKKKGVFLLYCYKDRFFKGFRQMNGKVRAKIKAQNDENVNKSRDQAITGKGINKQNRKICCLVINTLLDINLYKSPLEKKELAKSIKKKHIRCLEKCLKSANNTSSKKCRRKEETKQKAYYGVQ